MIKNLFTVLAIVAMGLTIQSCGVDGCTDPDSVNYNADATNDDGTCQYQGQVVFWYGQAVAEDNFVNDITALSVYIDGNVMASTSGDLYFASAPDCGAQGSMTVTMDLGDQVTQAANYEVRDQDGNVQWEGVVNFNANTCLQLELTL